MAKCIDCEHIELCEICGRSFKTPTIVTYVQGDKVINGDAILIDGKVFTCTQGGEWSKNITISITQ